MGIMSNIVLCLLFLATTPLVSFGQRTAVVPIDQKIFIQAAGDPLVIDINHDTLRIRPVEFAKDGAYVVDQCKFYRDWNLIEKCFNQLKLKEDRLLIKNGSLYLDKKLVSLPGSIKMRNVWQAVVWNEWVIILGRTSETDKIVTDIPPIVSSELITFNLRAMKASVRYISFQTPSGTEILVCESQCKTKVRTR